MGAFMDYYSERWPKIGAVAAMAMGGVSVLVNRTNRPSLRSLAVMNSMTMAAHQFEEYVEPGTFPGDVNRGIFRATTRAPSRSTPTRPPSRTPRSCPIF